jgi:DNA-binding transcriptional MerR regulator
MKAAMYSIGKLAQRVNDWCKQRGVEPLHKGAGEQVTVRNIRYYQAIGLVDRPLKKRGGGFSEKHRLQLIAVRRLQARGLTLGRIAALLKDRSEKDLREMEAGARDEESLAISKRSALEQAPGWEAQPISVDMWLLTRSGAPRLTAGQRQRIQEIVSPEWTNISEPVPRRKVRKDASVRQAEVRTEQDEELTTFRPEMD